jgi:hypothetical protein
VTTSIPLLAYVALNAMAEASGEEPNYAVLGQYGVLGVFAVLLVWFAKLMIGRETARADRLEAEVVRLNNTIQEKVIPALMSATGAVEESTEMIRDLQRDMREGYARRRPRTDESR